MPSTVNQAYVFLATVYAGFVMGFIYDLFRMIRFITRPGKFVTALLDLLFWITMGLLAFIVIFYVNYGEVRVYTIAGLAIGWALYALTLSPVIFKVMMFLYKMICRLVAKTVKAILWPFRLLGRLLAVLLRFVKRAVAGLFRNAKKMILKFSFKKDIKKITY